MSVAPTSQQDLGGLSVASNLVWPVTPIGVVRLAWAIPNDLQTFQSAEIAMIPGAPGGAAVLNLIVCAAQNASAVSSSCSGPLTQGFTGVPNQLVEVEIGGLIASKVGTPGADYVAVLAYTTPTTTTDHIVGLRPARRALKAFKARLVRRARVRQAASIGGMCSIPTTTTSAGCSVTIPFSSAA